LEDVRKRGVVVCISAVIFVTIVYHGATLWVAWHWERSSEQNEQIKGASLIPGNAEAWDRIGEAEEANFDAPPAGAIGLLEHAVKANPLSPRNWMDIAQAYEANGDVVDANTAYQKAQKDDPISADVAWKYGNFLLRQGETAAGLGQVHRSLLTDPRLVPLAISRVWHSDPDVEAMLHQVLPENAPSWFYALDFFSAQHDNDAAMEIWEDITSLAKTTPIDIHSVFPFLQELISQDKVLETQHVWEEAIATARWPSTTEAAHSRVWNGGFEDPIANGGLDWRLEGAPGTYISIDSNIYHSGKKSLRVDFTGGFNVDFYGVHEIVPVEPSTTYRFEYFMRTQDITTDSGLRFEILDLNDNEVSLMTPDLTGTNQWKLMQTEVVTGRNTHFLDVRLRRLPSQLFDNKLSGTVWIDDVSLTPETAAGVKARP
jgi:tetratricopeptide (TPR) repeat protein